MGEVHVYWVCNAYHFNGSTLRLPTQAIGQNLGHFPFNFLNENHRHTLSCGVVGPQASTTDSWNTLNTHWCHHDVTFGL